MDIMNVTLSFCIGGTYDSVINTSLYDGYKMAMKFRWKKRMGWA